MSRRALHYPDRPLTSLIRSWYTGDSWSKNTLACVSHCATSSPPGLSSWGAPRFSLRWVPDDGISSCSCKDSESVHYLNEDERSWNMQVSGRKEKKKLMPDVYAIIRASSWVFFFFFFPDHSSWWVIIRATMTAPFPRTWWSWWRCAVRFCDPAPESPDRNFPCQSPPVSRIW